MTGAAKNTVAKLLVDLGNACAQYQDRVFRGLTPKRVQCDEIWSFVGYKEKSISATQQGETGVGDIWTWMALDADTKLIISWQVGEQDAETACDFIDDLAFRLANRVQLTTDGLKVYLNAVEDTFGADIDYATLIKLYGSEPSAGKRYSPPVRIGAERTRVMGNPDPKHVSTSYIERQNLTMRVSMRRFTRLTNAFSKKLENHAAAISLHFMHYNFARPHQSLKTEKGQQRTPAMAAGISDHVWSVGETVRLLDSN